MDSNYLLLHSRKTETNAERRLSRHNPTLLITAPRPPPPISWQPVPNRSFESPSPHDQGRTQSWSAATLIPWLLCTRSRSRLDVLGCRRGGAHRSRSLHSRLYFRRLNPPQFHPTDFKQEIGAYTFWASVPRILAYFQISTSTGARYFASIVPIINCLRLLVHGLHFAHDEALIKSVTRHGNPEELLRGPLYYVAILIVCALVFWRDSPVGVISLAMMCGGDGIADIMGRRFGRAKIP